MFRLIFSVFTLSAIAIILVLTANPSQTAEARRFIRWDCSDWQPRPAVADADNELASSILETLAENRGKTLYCGLDQSDTWTKRQVYDHAHAHNDRDRTQYDGSQGQGRFRGFTAGQEGWLTDGEHGITGVSPERIFEFPQEERRRRKKTVILRKTVRSQSADAGYCPDNGNPGSDGQPYVEGVTTRGNLLCTNYGARTSSYLDVDASGQHQARNRYLVPTGSGGSNDWEFDWRTRAKTGDGGPSVAFVGGSSRSEAQWIAAAETQVIAACEALGGGYKYKRGSADFGMGHNRDRGTLLFDKGPGHGWFYAKAGHTAQQYRNSHFYFKARESRTWHGTCTKRVRR